MKKIIMLAICFVVGFFVYNKNTEIIIPNDSIRIRIIANSNSIEDLYNKKKLKEEVKDSIYNIVSRAKNFNEAKELIENNYSEIDKLISSKVNNYSISFGKHFFPKKVYKNVVYNDGEYESLIITLGDGLGDNWWCVLYPPLCLLEDNNSTSNVEYQLAIKKLLLN